MEVPIITMGFLLYRFEIHWNCQAATKEFLYAQLLVNQFGGKGEWFGYYHDREMDPDMLTFFMKLFHFNGFKLASHSTNFVKQMKTSKSDVRCRAKWREHYN